MVETQLPREKILSIAQKLPTTPRILGKLQRLLVDPNSGLDDICELLKRDMALSARIIRVSNSPYFGSASPHASLEDAVGCVGYTEIYRLVGFAISSQFLNRDLRIYGYTASQLWENSLITALAMESLASAAKIDSRGAYTIGLMRSIGKIVLDRLAAETISPDNTFPGRCEGPLGTWEATSFGCDNTAVTALLLSEWNFPEDIPEAVSHHYNPEGSAHAGQLASMLNIAGKISQDLGHGLVGEGHYWDVHPVKFTRAKIKEADLVKCMADTKVAFEDIRKAFGS